MSEKQKTPINIMRVLEIFIDEPINPKNYDGIIKLRKITSESRIREALRSLENMEILNTDYKRGRPRNPNKLDSKSGIPRDPKKLESQRGRPDHKIRSKNYQLNLEADIFKKIFDIFFNEGSLELFLRSNYVNKLTENYTLKEIYTQLEDEFRNQSFKRIATLALLNLTATIKEYEDYPDKIYKYLQDCEEYSVSLEDIWFDEIQVLEKFDPVKSVLFIREHLVDNLMDLYKKIGGRRIHLRSPDGRRLNEVDMHLSPFFSYPIYDPIQVIFSKPFDRLYDDIYILTKNDLGSMAERIYLVYTNFSEFLFTFLSTDWRYFIRLEDSLREYVFLWNCQSYYFSEFYARYHPLFSEEGSYYITSNSGFIQVIDLIKDKKLITPQDSFLIKSEITYPPLFTEGEWGGSKSNPLEVLLPCKSLFDEFGFETAEIPIDTILEEMREMSIVNSEHK